MPEEQYLTEKHYLVCTKGMLPLKVNVSSQDSTTFSGHLAATTKDTLKKKNFVCIGSTAFIAGVGAGVAAALAAAAAVALAALCVPGPGWILAAIIAVAIVGATAYGYHLCKCAAANRQWTLPSQRTSVNKNNALLISSVMQCPDHQGVITPKETLWAAFKSVALINLGHIANFAFGFLVGRGLGVVALEGFAATSVSGAVSAMGRSLLQAAKTELRDMYTWKGMWTLLQKRNFFCFGMRGLGIGGSYYNQYNIWTNDDTSLVEKIQASGIGIVCDIFAAKGSTVTCFPAGTKVHAKNGIANIEKLREGDLVLTFNEETKKQEYKPITKVHAHQTGGLLVVELPGSEFIKVTPDHRFYSNGEWIEVGKLEVGDTLQQKNGVYTFICGIEKLLQIIKVYNFDVEGNQNYYVTEDGILVHNGVCNLKGKDLSHGDIINNVKRNSTFARRFHFSQKWVKRLSGKTPAEVENMLLKNGFTASYPNLGNPNSVQHVLFTRTRNGKTHILDYHPNLNGTGVPSSTHNAPYWKVWEKNPKTPLTKNTTPDNTRGDIIARISGDSNFNSYDQITDSPVFVEGILMN